MEPSTSHASATDVAVVVRIAEKEKIPEPQMENVALDPVLHNRLTRFLHTGNEFPKYFPGSLEAQKCFSEDKLPVIDEIFALTPNNVQPVKVIYKTFMDGYYSRFETIAFALSKCLKVFKHSHIRQEAYDAALQMCSTPEQLMLFNKYNRIMKTGQGRGWCKNIKKWYLNKEPMELADEITRVKSRHGRSHKTLIRKSHLKVDANNHKLDTLIKYAIYGFKKTKQLKGDIEEAKEMLEYVHKVEALRQCENPVAAAAILAENHFTLDHVPGHLLTSQEAWDAVIPQFTMSELLYNIIRIHNLGFLRENSSTSQIILSLLTNREYVKKSNALPLEVYITYSNYTDPVSRPMKHEKAKIAKEKENRRRLHQTFDHKKREWVPNNKRRHPKELKYSGIDMLANVSIRAEIGNLVDKTWELSKPTGKKYMITMDMRNHMFKGRHFCKTASGAKKVKTSSDKSPGGGGDAAASADKKSNKRLRAECFYNTKVTPGHAALVVALQILKREKQVKIAVFTDDGGVDIVDLERNFITIDEAEVVLRKREQGRVQLDAPILWATRTRQPVDVFIDMIDRPSRYMELDKAERGGRAARRPLPGARAAAVQGRSRCSRRQADSDVSGVASRGHHGRQPRGRARHCGHRRARHTSDRRFLRRSVQIERVNGDLEAQSLQHKKCQFHSE